MNGRPSSHRPHHPYFPRRDGAAGAHQGAHRRQGSRDPLPLRGGRPGGRAAQSRGQAHLRHRPHGRDHDAGQQPLRPLLCLAAHRRVLRVLLRGQPHAAVRQDRLQGRHRRGQGRRARLPRDQRGGRRLPQRRRPLGSRRLRVRRQDRRAHRPQACPGLRHRPGRGTPGPLRLRQQQQVASAGPRRPRRRVRQQEPQGHRLARRQEGRGRTTRRVQGSRARPPRAHQGRPRRCRLPARRHPQHGAHRERRERLSHALLAQGHSGELRAHHRRDDARRARHPQRALPALRHESASSATSSSRAGTRVSRSRAPSTRRPTSSAGSARSRTSPRSCGSTTSATVSVWTA